MDAPYKQRTQKCGSAPTFPLSQFYQIRTSRSDAKGKLTLVFVSEPRRQLSLPFMGHPPILVGTISMVDSFILMVMALVVFGPRRLPQIGRQIGKLMYEFRKASNDFKFQMEEELRNAEEADRRKKEEERQRLLAAQTATEQASVSADPGASSQASATPSAAQNQYPEQYPPETPSSQEAAEDSVPRIQPPSVGETVARPARATAEPQTPDAAPAEAPSSDFEKQSSATNSSGQNPAGSSETAEALNQHG